MAYWRFGDVHGEVAPVPAPDIEQAGRGAELQKVREEAYAEGFSAGHAAASLEHRRQMEGFIQQQGSEAARHLAALLNSARAGLNDAQAQMAQGVLDLACELARQVLRNELSDNPAAALAPVIRESLDILVSDSQTALVKLHPADLHVLDAALKTEFAASAVQFVADASILPGGCVVASAGAQVDGSLPRRWARAVAALGVHRPWNLETRDAD